MPSILTPKDGIVQEWRTSAAVTNIRIWVLYGNVVRLSTSNNRKLKGFNSLEGII